MFPPIIFVFSFHFCLMLFPVTAMGFKKFVYRLISFGASIVPTTFYYVAISLLIANIFQVETPLYCASTHFRSSDKMCIEKCPDEAPLKSRKNQCYKCTEPQPINLMDKNNPPCPNRIIVHKETLCADYNFSIIKGVPYDIGELIGKEPNFCSPRLANLTPIFKNTIHSFFFKKLFFNDIGWIINQP